jgi:hypothetical protein
LRRARRDLLILQHRSANRGGIKVAHDAERAFEGLVMRLGALPLWRVLRSTRAAVSIRSQRARAWVGAGRLAWKSEA